MARPTATDLRQTIGADVTEQIDGLRRELFELELKVANQKP